MTHGNLLGCELSAMDTHGRTQPIPTCSTGVGGPGVCIDVLGFESNADGQDL